MDFPRILTKKGKYSNIDPVIYQLIIKLKLKMLAIRLQRVGRKKLAMYRVVVSEKSKDMYGNHLEILGTYNPHTKDTDLKEERIKHWLDNGAQASETVHNLFLKAGIVTGDKKKSVSISKKRRAKLEGAKAEAKEKSASAEKPAEEKAKPAEEKVEEKKEEPKEEPKKEEPKPAEAEEKK